MLHLLNRIVATARVEVARITATAGMAGDQPQRGRVARAGLTGTIGKRPRTALAMLAAVPITLPLATAAVASPAASLSTCARTAAGSAPPCPAHAITKAEKKIIALDEAPGGKPILKPYEDAEGYCTIGLGHLIRKGKCTAGDFADWKGATEQSLEELYNKDIASREAGLNAIVISRLGLKLNPCQYDALFDLYFNGGASWIGPKSRLYHALRNGDMGSVPAVIASDVPLHLSAKDTAVITARRRQDASRFRTKRCPCKFIEIYGTVRWEDQHPYGGGTSFGGRIQKGIFKIDLISAAKPHPIYWDTAGSTYQVSNTDDFGYVQNGNCTYTWTGSVSASGTLLYPPASPNADVIQAYWLWRYTPPWVGFAIGVQARERQTLTLSGSCSYSTTQNIAVSFNPICANQSGFPANFGARLNQKNMTIPIRCSGKVAGSSETYSLKGTLNVYPS